jgi:hypothetical protein
MAALSLLDVDPAIGPHLESTKLGRTNTNRLPILHVEVENGKAHVLPGMVGEDFGRAVGAVLSPQSLVSCVRHALEMAIDAEHEHADAYAHGVLAGGCRPSRAAIHFTRKR